MELFIILGVPGVVWIISYLYLAIYHRKWNLFGVTIHESGRYSLLQTIFYFNHFLREIMIDTIFVVCIFWTYLVVRPSMFTFEICGYLKPMLMALGAYLIAVFSASILQVGLKNTILDLLQFRELDTVVRFGSHWQMHFFSTLTLMLLLIFPATFVGMERANLIAGVFLLFFVLSFVFRTNIKSLKDRRWLLHGGREVLTYFLLGVIPFFVPLFASSGSLHLQPTWWTLVTMLLLLIMLAYPVLVLLRTNLSDLVQSEYGFFYLIASHFFEHILDFIYMALLIGVLVAWRSCMV